MSLPACDDGLARHNALVHTGFIYRSSLLHRVDLAKTGQDREASVALSAIIFCLIHRATVERKPIIPTRCAEHVGFQRCARPCPLLLAC